jgi:hypothetical protein
VKKTFDAVDWMRKRRTEIDEEDQGLSWEEKRKKTQCILEGDPLWLKLKNRLVEATAISGGPPRKYKGEDSEKAI